MDKDAGPQKIKYLLKNRKTKKPPAYEWQDTALRIIDELGIPKYKRNSVFKVCKEHSRPYIEKCLNDTKELCQKGESWKYFFKLIGKKSDDRPAEFSRGNRA